MNIESFESVWDALEDDPVEQARLKACSELMIAIESALDRSGWDDPELPTKLGLSARRLQSLKAGKVSRFDLDRLTEIATRAGVSWRLTVLQQAA